MENELLCLICGCSLEWEDCEYCAGEGWIDEYDDDPINYAPGEEFFQCEMCGGSGGWLECPNAENHHKNFQEGEMIELTEQEQRFLALAIQGLCLRQGPACFPFTVRLAEKLGIQGYLEEYLKSWIAYGGNQEKEAEQ